MYNSFMVAIRPQLLVLEIEWYKGLSHNCLNPWIPFWVMWSNNTYLGWCGDLSSSVLCLSAYAPRKKKARNSSFFLLLYPSWKVRSVDQTSSCVCKKSKWKAAMWSLYFERLPFPVMMVCAQMIVYDVYSNFLTNGVKGLDVIHDFAVLITLIVYIYMYVYYRLISYKI